MINLIPNEEKKEMSKDFYLRLLTVFFSMLGVSVIIAFVLILPSYFFSVVEQNSINTKISLQDNEVISQSDQDTILAVKELKEKLALIENIKTNKKIFSQKIINEILLKKMPYIKINEIFYENNQKSEEVIKVSGRAPSRDALLSFRRSLEDNIAFSKVDLPISNFIKGSNIKFYLTLIPSKN